VTEAARAASDPGHARDPGGPGTSVRLELVVCSAVGSGRRVNVDRSVVIGRTQGDILLADDSLVSGRHLRVTRRPDGVLVAEDLGSTNGTCHNGEPVRGPVVLAAGDSLTVGDTVIEIAWESVRSPPPGFTERQIELGSVAYRPGSAGAAVAAQVASALASAHRHLAALISLTGELRPRVLVVDPFPDPAAPGRMLTRGAVVDSAHCELWVVVTAETPLEPLERSLATLLGARLPAADELAPLLEGYGLRAGGAPDPAGFLRDGELPALAAAQGDLASAMARSFVGFLLARADEETFLRLLAEARPGELDQAALATFGQPLGNLEATWRATLRSEAELISTSRFVRLAASYLRPYRRRELELFVLALLSLTFVVAFPFGLRSLLNDAIPSGKFTRAADILALLALAMAVSLLAGWRQSYQAAYVGGSVVRDIRLAMFDRLQRLELSWFGARDSGDVLTRLVTDVELLELGLSQSLRGAVVQLLTYVVAGATALVINLWLGLVTVIAAPIIGVVYRVMSAGAQRRSFSLQQQLGAVSSIATENLAAQPVVKAFGLEQRERARLSQASDNLFRSALRLNVFTGAFTVSVELITTVLAILVLALGAWLIIHHHLTIGGLVAFTAILDRVLIPATALADIGGQIQTSSGALIRINEVLEAAPELVETADAVALPRLQRALELRNVSFSYSAQRQVLSDINVEIPAGSRVAFVGPSGAGKSSIIALLLRFADPDSGAMLVDGVDVRRGTLASLRGQIGVVLQQTFLFNASVRENIGLGSPHATAAEIEHAARQASLVDVLESLPEGSETVVGERGGRLSGGQAQRVAIARAVVRDPAILVLDEATSALDPRTERGVTETLKRAGAGRTTIAVTHRLASVRDYDAIFVMAEGRIVERGTHAELLAVQGKYAELWLEQTEGVTPASADLCADLARLPLFAALGPDELTLVEDSLQPLALGPGERLSESDQRLAIVARGRGRVLVPGVGNQGLVSVAELGPGQAFGLSALLGEPTGAVLEASAALTVLCLDTDRLDMLVERLPAVAAALRGNQATVVSPVRGRRLGFSGSFAVQRTHQASAGRRG
jgi:ABC-type multidrug transport system fused ATPase/permease subunit